jgi:hypothetical protein
MKRESSSLHILSQLLMPQSGLSAKNIKNYVDKEVACEKESCRLQPNGSPHPEDAEGTEKDEDEEPVASLHGFIIQTLRIEVLQYVLSFGYVVLYIVNGTYRHQVTIEAQSSEKGLSLATNNAGQRQTSLMNKLALHEQSRTFYMPGFEPPPQDADLLAEAVSLHLPSSLTPAQQSCFCWPGLVQAEQDIRLSAMDDGLVDLVRQLQTRTFLHQYKARDTTGVQMKTQARDLVAGVSCRVDASAATYRRH